MPNNIAKDFVFSADQIEDFVDWSSAGLEPKADSIFYANSSGEIRVGWDENSRSLPLLDSSAWQEFFEKMNSLDASDMFQEKSSKLKGYKKHKYNESFAWEPMKGPFKCINDEQAAYYDKNGFVVLDRKVPMRLVNALVAEADEVEEKRQKILRKLKQGKGFIARDGEISFTTHLVKQSDLYQKFYRSDLFQDIASDFVGPDVKLYWDQAVYKKPGVESPFPWHQDNGYTFVQPQQYITVWIALTDATKENGCMWFVPEVHRLGTIEHDLTDLGYAMYVDEPPKHAIPVECEAGTVIVLSALCPHMTGFNHTDKTRRALVAQFVSDKSVQLTEDIESGEIIVGEVKDETRQFLILKNGEKPHEANIAKCL